MEESKVGRIKTDRTGLVRCLLFIAVSWSTCGGYLVSARFHGVCGFAELLALKRTDGFGTRLSRLHCQLQYGRIQV